MNNDNNWIHIADWLRKKQINYYIETDLNMLNDLIESLQTRAAPNHPLGFANVCDSTSLFNITKQEKEEKLKEKSILLLENIFIFDDK